jgi:hypothetical protein
MKLIFSLFFMAVVAIAFVIFRTLSRSPKLDRFFDISKRDENADDILSRQQAAEQDLTARGRTLSKRKKSLDSEINKINKKNQQ